jgi:hypothetical protein
MEYFVSSDNGGFDNRLELWAMYNTSTLALPNPNPTMTRIFTTCLSYYFPAAAKQRPGPLPYGSSLTPPGELAFLDGSDSRVLSVSYSAARLFITLQTALLDQNNNEQDGGLYVILAPTMRNTTLTASVVNQGYLYVNGDSLMRPSIAVNSAGAGAIAVTLVGNDYYPSPAYIPLAGTTATPTLLKVPTFGTLPEDGFTGYPGGGQGVARWGDYNSAVTSTDGSIWTGVQWIGSFPRAQFANWNTYVTQVQQ